MSTSPKSDGDSRRAEIRTAGQETSWLIHLAPAVQASPPTKATSSFRCSSCWRPGSFMGEWASMLNGPDQAIQRFGLIPGIEILQKPGGRLGRLAREQRQEIQNTSL